MKLLSGLFVVLFSMPGFAQDLQQLTTAVKDHYKMDAAEAVSYRHALTDLNGDGLPDAVVLLSGSRFCGSGGCNMAVFRGSKSGFTFVSGSTITREPIRVMTEKNAGWNALIVYTNRIGDMVMRFDGSRYPLNPSTQPKASEAQLKAARILLPAPDPPDAWAYSEEVFFKSREEPHGVILQDGRRLTVEYEATGLRPEEIDGWLDGRKLTVAYSAARGAVLLDPEKGSSASILRMPQQHPIEQLTRKCLEGVAAQTTQGMVECYAEELPRWDRELNRLYGRLMDSLDAPAKAAVQAAQREWLRYRDAQKAAIGAVYMEGTISRITRVIEVNRLTKEQTEKLANFLAR